MGKEGAAPALAGPVLLNVEGAAQSMAGPAEWARQGIAEQYCCVKPNSSVMMGGLGYARLASKAWPHGSISNLKNLKNLHPKWGKLLWLKEIFKKNFDPKSAAVLGILHIKEWVDLLGQTPWGLWQVEKAGVVGYCMMHQCPQGNICCC